MTTTTRLSLGNGAHNVRLDEIARLRIDRTPIVALVTLAQGTAAIPTTIILTASNRPEDNVPDYGLAYIQDRPSKIVHWMMRAGTGTERWIEGRCM